MKCCPRRCTYHLLRVMICIQFPTRIICPDDWSSKWTEPHHAVTDRAISALEAFLGVKRKVLKFSDVWEKSPPPEADGKSFQEFFKFVSASLDWKT